jgi:hypothetical protein
MAFPARVNAFRLADHRPEASLETNRARIVAAEPVPHGAPSRFVLPRVPNALPRIPNALPRVPNALPLVSNPWPLGSKSSPLVSQPLPRVPRLLPQAGEVLPPVSYASAAVPSGTAAGSSVQICVIELALGKRDLKGRAAGLVPCQSDKRVVDIALIVDIDYEALHERYRLPT